MTTVEGLAGEDGLHPIQQAFRERHGLQCGFCTPGMLLAAKALLDEIPDPSEEEIRESPRRQRLPLHGLRRHRRGGAPGGAGARGGARDDGPLRRRARDARRGSPLPRGPGRLPRRHRARRARCTSPSCRSPHAHARIVSIDSSRARALEGVALVVTGEDLRDLPPFTTTIATRARGQDRRRAACSPIERVRFVGEAVAAVVASSRAIAEDAAELIDVEYEPLPAVLDAGGGARARRAASCTTSWATTTSRTSSSRRGDVDGGVRRRRARLPQALPLRPLPRGAARGPRRDRRLGRGRGVGDRLDVDADAVPRARHARGAVRARRTRACASSAPRSGAASASRCSSSSRRRSSPSCRAAWARRSSGSRTATRRWPRAAHSKEVICELALATDADGRFLALRGPLRRRRRRVSRPSVDEPHRPALRGLVPARACTTSRTSATRSTRRSRTSASRRRTAASAGRRGRRRARR